MCPISTPTDCQPSSASSSSCYYYYYYHLYYYHHHHYYDGASTDKSPLTCLDKQSPTFSDLHVCGPQVSTLRGRCDDW